jgi:AraC family transcriptional regulator, transcriptional activator of pobA
MNLPTTRIKHYKLYGERETESTSRTVLDAWTNSFHFELIPERSKHYNWEIEPHVHDSFLQIMVLNQGQAEVMINGSKTQLQSPTLIFIPAQNVHSFRLSSDVDGPVITVAQQPIESMAKIVMPALGEVLRRPWIIPLGTDAKADAALQSLLDAIEHEWRIHSYGHAAAGLSLLAALLVHIGRYTQSFTPKNLLQTPKSRHAPARQAQVVEKFRGLVNEKFKTNLGVDAYARRLGVSAGQLTRLTKSLLGQTALEVIQARILFEAERDLTYTSDSIKQIAANLGFDDEAYFSRFFRRKKQQTPREFRVQALA